MKIKVIQADITTIKVDAIINAANSSLLGGSGVDGAIHRKGGTQVLEACRAILAKQGKCKVGEAVITTAGNLRIKTIAFPNISTGIYKFPKELAAKIAIETVRSFVDSNKLQEVMFVCLDLENFELYKKLLK